MKEGEGVRELVSAIAIVLQLALLVFVLLFHFAPGYFL
jgi:hypothetical protein